MSALRRSERRWLVPEVVQTSAMDCGPAVLKCLLEGYGIPIHYGRLREACQTDVDGTSIDVLEDVAGKLGLEAEQVMMPVDHLALDEAEALPAILVVRQPSGFTHFVLIWRRHGPLVQVMDPAVGRRWLTCRQLLEEVYVHSQCVPAEAWRDWAVSDGLRRPLARRLVKLGLRRENAQLINAATQKPGWRPLANLDAATRLVQALVNAGGVRRGHEARGVLNSLLDRDSQATADGAPTIPDPYWSVERAPPDPSGDEQLLLRGAVLVRILGRRDSQSASDGKVAALSPELAAALTEPGSRPGRELWRLIRDAGLTTFVWLAIGLALIAGAAVLEAIVLRSVIDIGRDLVLVEQRLVAVGCVLLLGGVLLLVDLRVAGGLLRLGRRLETSLRTKFLEKIPRLNDRYFQSRPISDMAERSHVLEQIRLLPRLVGQFLRASLTVVITVAALAWIAPEGAPWAALAAILAIAVPLACIPRMQSLDLRVRTHTGALTRFYLDALLGLSAIRAHGAQQAVRCEHESLLVEWSRAGQRLLATIVLTEGLQALVGFSLATWILMLHVGQTADAAGMLLLAYWALNLPILGEELALLLRQYPLHRNVTLRLLEPLGAPEEVAVSPHLTASETPAVTENPSRRGVSLTLEDVTVNAAGRTILENLNVHFDAGAQVAIVGASGAGKSSLVGLLLGWHRAAAGRILVDGRPLDAARLDQLRDETAWVDPAVQLWNRPLLYNLLYGCETAGPSAVGDVLQQADLYAVLQRLPDGLQTELGEGGGLLSGGEGQRVRLGRALGRSQPRLVVLDEPFRGLDREQRRELLDRMRRRWQSATLLCITHDIGETRDFPRVLVIDRGQIVEDGAPATLAADSASHYRALLDAEEAVRTGLWSSSVWKRWRLDAGRLTEPRSTE